MKSGKRCCETCAIPWDLKMANDIMRITPYIREYEDCPLQQEKNTLGSDFIERIINKVSCDHWKQIHCIKCKIPIDGTAYDYCGRPHCTPCGSGEDFFDDEYS